MPDPSKLVVPTEECSDCLLINNNPASSSRDRRMLRKRGCPNEGCRYHGTWLRRKRGPKGIVGPS